ncbi:hypothetical protein C1I95_27235 [Micromonospora craterilacus]|uniref:Uncharacterized protein n=1 Tax=Micromonospora craterilacus TaxID=1655439 RepID=A0A2W2E4D2_9ACTN|nr:hypothetical protein C1I95_27235 [Micromonospora craterilacus]
MGEAGGAPSFDVSATCDIRWTVSVALNPETVVHAGRELLVAGPRIARAGTAERALGAVNKGPFLYRRR